jgi:hypothetical protein
MLDSTPERSKRCASGTSRDHSRLTTAMPSWQARAPETEPRSGVSGQAVDRAMTEWFPLGAPLVGNSSDAWMWVG